MSKHVGLGVSQFAVFPIPQTMSVIPCLQPLDYAHLVTPPACQVFFHEKMSQVAYVHGGS